MRNLKLLTLNLHCLVEENLEEKQRHIVDEIIANDVDIIFLQEVAQSRNAPVIEGVLKEDNYGVTLQTLLHQQKKTYYLYYQPIKKSFDLYDEGIALLSKYKLDLIRIKHISRTTDYNDWKSRKIMCYQLKNTTDKIYLATTHFGWSDGYEVFEDQVDLAVMALPKTGFSIVAGDFNVTPDSTEFQHLLAVGLHDIFAENEVFSMHPTHHNPMDIHHKSSRIDYIMTTRKVTVLERKILFKDHPVSDHYGVYAKIKIK